jgi:tRNA threonylcarbamoyladenosine biosynthesis protein TsaB
LAYAADVPVVGVSSLKVMAEASSNYDEDIIVPLIDARRDTVFAGLYGEKCKVSPQEGHYHISEILKKVPKKLTPCFVGDAEKFRDEIRKKWDGFIMIPNDEFAENRAVVLARVAQNMTPLENVHELNPVYLRKTEAEINAGL